MSFTSIVKNEVSKLDTIETENVAELAAMIRNIGEWNKECQVATENASVARRICNLLKKSYDVMPSITVRRGYNFNKNYIYILHIHHKKKEILEDLCIVQKEHSPNIPEEYIIADEDLMRAYLRGLFLAIGSINDPKKSRYHLEFLVDNKKYAQFVSQLLNTFDLKSKVLKRETKYMIYVKEAEKIGDFLRIVNAMSSLFYYEDIRIYRDHKNMTNRLNNCEQANVDKIVQTAHDQVKDIETIKEINGLDLLDEKVKEVAIYRLKYPDVSLQELSEIITIETGHAITKSGLHHRFRKIKEMANRIKK